MRLAGDGCVSLLFGLGAVYLVHTDSDIVMPLAIFFILFTCIFLGRRLNNRVDNREAVEAERIEAIKGKKIAFLAILERGEDLIALTSSGKLRKVNIDKNNRVKDFKLYSNPERILKQLSIKTDYAWKARSVEINGRNFTV